MTIIKSGTSLPPGTLFEYRVARLRFCQGLFVRRSIDIWPSGADKQQLAEIDICALAFDPQMHKSLEIVECKTGAKGQGEIDRLLWLKGLGIYINSNHVTFAKLQIAPRTRDFARQTGVDVMDENSIATIERSLGIKQDWWPGFHNPIFGETIVKPARIELASNNSLRRAGRYLFGGFWFVDDFTRIKQLRSLFRTLVDNSSTLPQNALKLCLGEATTLFTLAALSIASWQNQLTEDNFKALVIQELSTGLGDPNSLRHLLHRIDDLKRKEIEELHLAYQAIGIGKIPFKIQNLETEILIPPEWVEGFIELISRFSKRPDLATNILRWADLKSATLLGYKISKEDHVLFHQQQQTLETAVDLVTAFITRMWGVPIEFFKSTDVTKLTTDSTLTTSGIERTENNNFVETKDLPLFS